MGEMRYRLVILLSFHLVVVDCLSGSAELNSTKKEINFLLMLSFETEGSTRQPKHTDGKMILPSAELAVEQINEREDILEEYWINLVVTNSTCDLTDYTAINFVSSFYKSNGRFVGIIGPACSAAAEFVSAITRKEEFSIINIHTASSTKLSDRSKYPLSFGTAASAQVYIKIFLALMKYNNWTNIAVFYDENNAVYLSTYDYLVSEVSSLSGARITLSLAVSHQSLPLSSLTQEYTRTRIVLVLTSSDLSHKIACLIAKSNGTFTYPSYQFFFIATYGTFNHRVVFRLNNQHYNCTGEDILSHMEGFILLHTILNNHFETELVSEMTFREYWSRYKNRSREGVTLWANPVYDGVWSLALALNNSIPELRNIGVDLEDYTYGWSHATEIIRNEVVKLKFSGASGTIAFLNDTGYTGVKIDMKQNISKRSTTLIGRYDEIKDIIYLATYASFIDDTFKLSELLIHPVLASFSYFITFITFLLIFTSHVLTVKYRNFSSIKASSFKVGQNAFIGCYLILLCLLCDTIQKAAPTTSVRTVELCILTRWFFHIGLTLILATVSARTWRLYRIFVNLQKRGKLLSDWVLIGIVLTLAGIDILFHTAWTASSNFTLIRHETVINATHIEVYVQCSSDNFYAWLGAVGLFHAAIMISALVLALLTRKIRHKKFKTKSVTILVYSLTVTLLLGLTTFYILETVRVNVNIEYIVISLTYLATVYESFVFLFFPPVLYLLREKLFHKLPGLKNFSKEVKPK